MLHKVLRVDHPERRDHQLCLVLLGGGDQLFGKIRGQPVVTVHELDVLAVGQPDAPVSGIGRAGIGFVDHGDAVVFGGKAGADGSGVVGGAVVQQ